MKNKKTLLIIAAGMGSRYGGLKQIDPVGPSEEIIIDYSMYDAIRAGFDKIVFVIRHYFEDAFREKIGRKLEGRVEVAYAWQEMESCLEGFHLPPGRTKPWGTGHAVLVAKEQVREPFAVINADDYYGPGSFWIIARFLDKMDSNTTPEYAMAGFLLSKTLSAYGKVSRGVCTLDGDMFLQSIHERTDIRQQDGRIFYTDDDGTEHPLTGREIVSMNLWAFGPDFFQYLREQFHQFLRKHGRDDKREFFLPSAVDCLVEQGIKKVKVLATDDSWFGVTYRPDREIAQRCILERIEKGEYCENLWSRPPCNQQEPNREP